MPDTPRSSRRDRPSADALDASVRLARVRRQMFARVGRPRIAHYHLLRQIGGGGMGLVFAAWDPSLDRMIAIKVLRDPSARGSDLQLRREALALARLRHPNVVSVFEVGDHEGQVYLAMEYLAGRTLRAWSAQWRDAGRDLRALLDVFLQAAEGLIAAHAAGLVHRDIKPDNIMIEDDGRVRLMDFGLARDSISTDVTPDHATGAKDPSASVTDHSRGLLGTPAYMAPEQLRGDAPGEAADQFALCACLYEALYGRRVRSNRFEEAVRVADEAIDVPATRGVPRALAAALRRGLDVDPQRRWPSIAQLADELARIRRPPRRRWFVAGAVILAAGGVASGLSMASTPGPAPCVADLQGVWDDAIRADMTAFFADVGGPRGTAAWPRAQSRLDDYAAAWSRQYESSCRATFVSHEQSERRFDLRMSCLERRRNRLAAAVGAMRAARDEADLLERIAVAFRLPPLDQCEDVAALESAEPLPDDPHARSEVARIRDELDRGDALWDAGDFVASEKIARAAVEDAQATGYLPVVSESMILLARNLSANRTSAEAEKLARDVIMVAAQAGDPRSEAIAWQELMMALTLQDREEEASHYVLAAKSAAERADDDVVRSWLFNDLGALYSDLDDIDRAHEHFAHALELKRAALGPDHFDVAITAYNVANALINHERYDEARAPMLEARRIAQATVGDGHPIYLVSTFGLCRLEYWADDYETALPFCEEATAGMEAIDFAVRFTGRAYFTRGRVLWELGRHEEARKHIARGLELADEGDPGTAKRIREWIEKRDPDAANP